MFRLQGYAGWSGPILKENHFQFFLKTTQLNNLLYFWVPPLNVHTNALHVLNNPHKLIRAIFPNKKSPYNDTIAISHLYRSRQSITRALAPTHRSPHKNTTTLSHSTHIHKSPTSALYPMLKGSHKIFLEP
jgi:hypothetical protein